MSEPDYHAMYASLAYAYDCIARVARGLCPKCGAVREDDDCKACGHHSLYVRPFLDAAPTEREDAPNGRMG